MSKAEKYFRVSIFVILIGVIAFATSARADDGSSPWTWRANFVLILADSDFDPVDNLFGASLDVLYDLGENFRVGGELQWATGDEEKTGKDLETDWLTFLLVGEYVLLVEDNFDIYAGLGIGIINVDADETVLGLSASGDDTTFALRPAVGADIFLTEVVAVNVQAGYLWSEVDFGMGDASASGLEGKVGITVSY